MPTYVKGNVQITDLYVMDKSMDFGYHADDIVFQRDQEYYESETPGTAMVTLPKGYYEVILVAGGGGGSSYVGGAGAYFHGRVWLEGECTIVISDGGNAGGRYCRNNSGASALDSTLTSNGAVITCPGGRYGCARRKCGTAGLTYAPTYEITNDYTIMEVSTEQTRQEAWYLTYGQGGAKCTCDTCNGFKGNAGYCMLKYVGRS